LKANGVWIDIAKYMKKSYIMEGNYLQENIYNIEDEAYHMSGGKSSPISAVRFREISRL